MKKLLCSLVALSMMASTLPVAAAASENGASSGPKAGSLKVAIQQTATRVALEAAPAASPQSGNLPRSMPRPASTKVRHQGGGGVGMAIGIVSTLIGVGTTVYLVKQTKKATDQAKQ